MKSGSYALQYCRIDLVQSHLNRYAFMVSRS